MSRMSITVPYYLRERNDHRKKSAGRMTASDKAYAMRRGIEAKLMLCVCALLICWVFCLRHGMFGSKVDWISQHSVLPDYFRRQFYETGNLFPEFAANIGGGQNIYNFSYYGLYSPVILLSYFFPFVKMADYLMAAQIVCLAAAGVLLYQWFLGRGFERRISFLTSILFLLAGPMVYQSYNQIMFVDYMPFLCMGFLGVERHFEKRKSGLLTAGVFLMIMTSFYFSIGGMLALGLYGLHRYIGERGAEYGGGSGRKEKKAAVFAFFQEGIRFLMPFFIAVCMSGVLLIPTAAALMGRKGGSKGAGITAADLFLPEFSAGRFFYSPYGIGLTTFAVTALLSMLFFKRWRDRVLAWGCVIVLTVPFFAWALNGGLYVRDKVMIPFLPLLCYVTAYYADHMDGMGERREKKGNVFMGALPYAAVFGILTVHFIRSGFGRYGKLLLADAVIMLLSYVLFCMRKNVLFLLIPPVILLALFGNAYNIQKNNYVSSKFYEEVTDGEDVSAIREAVKTEKGFYRTEQLGTEDENAANLNRIWDMGQYVSSVYSSLYNDDYQQFRKAFGVEQPYRNFLMQPALKNPVYQRFMGVKYVVEDGKLRENRLASPVAYVTDKVMEKKEYERMHFPENQLALLDYAVVKEDGAAKKKRAEKREAVPVPVSLPAEIDSEKSQTVRVNIPESSAAESEKNNGAERVLFLKFCVENLRPSRDVTVWFEGERSKLTAEGHFYYNENTVFTYAVPAEGSKRQAELVFSAGHYRISDAECFMGTLPAEKDAKELYQSGLILDRERTKGNVIAGSAVAKRAGYLITTIPFDQNFKIFVDGKSAKTEKVNSAFLGCRVKGGEHEIQIVYHAPGTAAGKAVSVIGVLLFCANLFAFCGSQNGYKQCIP